jgi:hypothetical protein
MATSTCPIRFMGNNWAEKTRNTILTSSEKSSNPLSNLKNPMRGRSWSPVNGGSGYTDEYILWDFGTNPDITYVSLLAPQEGFGFSDSVTLSLEASNVTGYVTPSFQVNLTYDSSLKEISFFQDDLDVRYRFWKLIINDVGNTNDIYIGYIYLGDYLTFTSSNVSQGFSKEIIDRSELIQSENESIYTITRNKYHRITDIKITYLTTIEMGYILELYNHIGTHTPFGISLDPTLVISDDIYDLTKFVFFENQPTFTHNTMGRYTVEINVREAQ